MLGFDDLLEIAFGAALYYAGSKAGEKKTLEALYHHQKEIEIQRLKKEIYDLKNAKIYEKSNVEIS